MSSVNFISGIGFFSPFFFRPFFSVSSWLVPGDYSTACMSSGLRVGDACSFMVPGKSLNWASSITQNRSIQALNLVHSLFRHSLWQICYTIVFAGTSSRGFSELVTARGLTHSYRTTNLFFVYFSAQSLTHWGCYLQHSLVHFVRCCFLSVGIHICSPPHNSIHFPF